MHFKIRFLSIYRSKFKSFLKILSLVNRKFQTSIKIALYLQALAYFPANGSKNPDVFWPKTFCIPRGIIPQNFSSSGLVVSQELWNKQTNRQTHSLTFYCFSRVITITVDNVTAHDLKYQKRLCQVIYPFIGDVKFKIFCLWFDN